MTPRLVGLAGPAGAGKSTAAALIAADGGWRLISFAEPLRAWACELHPEWALLDLLGADKDRQRPPGPLGWGRAEDIVIQHLAELTGADVVCLHPFGIAGLVSALQEWLSPRATLRLLGDAVKAVDPEAFVRHAARRIERARQAGESVVVDDVRYEPEATLIRTLGGVILHVRRPGIAYRRDHTSEQGIAATPPDRHLCNPATLRELRGELLSVLQPAYRVREVAA